MAAGAWTVYSNAVLEMTQAVFNLSTDTYFMILATTSYVPAPDTDFQYSNVSANELTTAGGYTVGGVKLTSVTDTRATGTVTFTSANATWASFTATFRYGVIVRSANGTGLAATDKLLCYSDLGGGSSITGGGGTLIVQPNTAGIFTVTHSP